MSLAAQPTPGCAAGVNRLPCRFRSLHLVHLRRWYCCTRSHQPLPRTDLHKKAKEKKFAGIRSLEQYKLFSRAANRTISQTGRFRRLSFVDLFLLKSSNRSNWTPCHFHHCHTVIIRVTESSAITTVLWAEATWILIHWIRSGET